MKEVDIETVSIEVIGLTVSLYFMFNAPRRLALYAPVRLKIGEKFVGKYVIDSVFGYREFLLDGPTVTSERQLVRQLLAMIDYAMQKEYRDYDKQS